MVEGLILPVTSPGCYTAAGGATASGVAVGSGDLGEVGFDGVGCYGRGVGQQYLQGVRPKVVLLLGQGLGKAVELVKGGH